MTDRIWLITFRDYDLGHFNNTECRMEPLENPFGPKVRSSESDRGAESFPAQAFSAGKLTRTRPSNSV